MENGLVAIIIFAILAGTAIILVPFCLVWTSIHSRKRSRNLSTEEQDSMRRLWEGLRRMEKRIENLETIMISARSKRER